MSHEVMSRNDQELQRTICLITELLGVLKMFRHDLRQSSRIESEISSVVIKLEFLIEECDYIGTTTHEQIPEEYQLSSRPVCPDCKQQQMNSGKRRAQAAEPVTPPVWQSSLQFALWCARLVADEYFNDTAIYGSLPLCLLELRTVLHRLQQLLPASATMETKLSVADFPNACPKCGKSLEAIP